MLEGLTESGARLYQSLQSSSGSYATTKYHSSCTTESTTAGHVYYSPLLPRSIGTGFHTPSEYVAVISAGTANRASKEPANSLQLCVLSPCHLSPLLIIPASTLNWMISLSQQVAKIAQVQLVAASDVQAMLQRQGVPPGLQGLKALKSGARNGRRYVI